jgi:hypothetical protein
MGSWIFIANRTIATSANKDAISNNHGSHWNFTSLPRFFGQFDGFLHPL